MEERNYNIDHQNNVPLLVQSSTAFVPGGEDIPVTATTTVAGFIREFVNESKKLWFLAAPSILTFICQFSLGAVTQVFAGHVSTLALAAISVQTSVITGLAWGIMMGMGSALETLCGQAIGAGQVGMTGVYMQRSWVILTAMAVVLMPLYALAGPFLAAIGQPTEISAAAGQFAAWMIPQLFALAANFPAVKFLQAQSKVGFIMGVSAAALAANTLLSWVLMVRLQWGLAGAAVSVNVSWWFIAVAQLGYILSGACGKAWSGFSWQAFRGLLPFVRLSLASGVMLCLEVWYFMVLVLFAGYLKNAQVQVDALSICMNIVGWAITVSMGMNAAISVRVSNELGAIHPRAAKLSVVVAVISTFLICLIPSLILIITRNDYPSLFSNDLEVKAIVKQLTPTLVVCVVINSVQPVLSGVAVGAGWQASVAYVNIACYYAFGVPLGLIFGYKLNMGVTGIWFGMLTGTVAQTIILVVMAYKTNWNKEASSAGNRIKKWGGHEDFKESDVEI